MRYHKKYDMVISNTLSLFHSTNNYAYMLVTIVCKPDFISPIEAWSKSAEDLDRINDALSKHPNYVYSIGVIEPHLNSRKVVLPYDGLVENLTRPQVEVERLFTHYYAPKEGQSAQDAFNNITSNIEIYKQTQNVNDKDVYDFFRTSHPSKQKRTHDGYPRFLIVLCSSADRIVSTRFPSLDSYYDFIEPFLPSYLTRKNINSGRHSQTYCKESTMTTRSINDTKILLFALKNTLSSTYSDLIGQLPVKLYKTPPEIVSIFKALSSQFKYDVDYGDVPRDEECKRIVIGNGESPSPHYYPIIAPVSKTHNCIILILAFMRKYKIYFDEDKNMFYKHVDGSYQTYSQYGDIQVLLNGVSSENTDKVELLKVNSPYIRKCSQSKESFFDKIIINNTWVEYSDFCLNLICGLATPKDGRYPCFAFFFDVQYHDSLWACDSSPQMWLKFLMDLKIVKYDLDEVNKLKVAMPHILNRLYELVVPRTDNCIRNLSVNDERVFSLLLTPFFHLYKDIVYYDNLASYDPNVVDKCSLVVLINPKFTKKLSLDKICNMTINKKGTRTVVVDTITTSSYPHWAFLGNYDDRKLHLNFNDAFDRLSLEDTALTSSQIDNLSSIRSAISKESGSIFVHLAANYFSGLTFLSDPSEIDKYILEERAYNIICHRNQNKYLQKPEDNKGPSLLIPILSKEQLAQLKDSEEKESFTPKSSTPTTYIDRVFADIEWPTFSKENISSPSPLIKNPIYNTFVPDFPF